MRTPHWMDRYLDHGTAYINDSGRFAASISFDQTYEQVYDEIDRRSKSGDPIIAAWVSLIDMDGQKAILHHHRMEFPFGGHDANYSEVPYDVVKFIHLKLGQYGGGDDDDEPDLFPQYDDGAEWTEESEEEMAQIRAPRIRGYAG